MTDLLASRIADLDIRVQKEMGLKNELLEQKISDRQRQI